MTNNQAKKSGLSSISPRMKYLRKLAVDDENPIVQALAIDLTTDPKLIKAGNIFEICVYLNFLPCTVALSKFSLLASSLGIMTVSMLFEPLFYILWMFAFISGFRLFLFPGLRLMSKDPNGNSLKFLCIHPNEMFQKILLMQFYSCIIPILYCLIGSIILTILVILINFKLTTILIVVAFTLFKLFNIMFYIAFFLFIGVSIGFRCLNPAKAVGYVLASSVGTLILFFQQSMMIEITPMAIIPYGLSGTPEYGMLIFMVGMLIVGMIFQCGYLALIYWHAQAAVRLRIMPQH